MTQKIPQHIAIIMDGNGRWAQQRGLPRIAGHDAGARAVRTVVESCREMGIPYLTLYAFSQENWTRPPDEIGTLWRLLGRYLREEEGRLRRNEIRLRAIGRWHRLPEAAQEQLQRVMDSTAKHKAMTLTLALSYGGRDEIVDAAQALARKCSEGRLNPDEIDIETFRAHLYAPDIPDPDLLIRTSGEMRLSNFLLWQCAYAELVVLDTFWPDFGKRQLAHAIDLYSKRERRFGGIKAVP